MRTWMACAASASFSSIVQSWLPWRRLWGGGGVSGGLVVTRAEKEEILAYIDSLSTTPIDPCLKTFTTTAAPQLVYISYTVTVPVIHYLDATTTTTTLSTTTTTTELAIVQAPYGTFGSAYGTDSGSYPFVAHKQRSSALMVNFKGSPSQKLKQEKGSLSQLKGDVNGSAPLQRLEDPQADRLNRAALLLAGCTMLIAGLGLLSWHCKSDGMLAGTNHRTLHSFSRPDPENDDPESQLCQASTPRTPALLRYAPVDAPGLISIAVPNGSYQEDRSGIRRGWGAGDRL